MEAMQTECVEGYEDNQVIRVLQAGYMYKDRVLRPAIVVVNKKEIKEEKEV
jgi:molecular chaperone GrpE